MLRSSALPGLLGLLVLSACTKEHTLRLADVTKTNHFNLTSRFGDFVSGISFHVTGRLDGSARLVLNGAETQVISDAVNWKVYQYLQSSNCVVDYLPESVKSGHLTVQYNFH